MVRLADDSFVEYVLGSDLRFDVRGYAQPQIGQRVADWVVEPVTPYLKCYGIDASEFASLRDRPDSAVFMAWLGGHAVGHVVLSTHWNGFAYVNELAVDERSRRSGVARALLGAARFWAAKQHLPGIMLETQNNNLAACRLYERCGFVLGGIDRLRYYAIDPKGREMALFWYWLPEAETAPD